MFISCGPNQLPKGHSKRFPVTCGDAKGNKFNLNFFIVPSDPQCEQKFVYGTLGTISPNPVNNEASVVMIHMLNLSEPTLQLERGILLQAIESEIVNGEISPANKEETLQIWRSRDDKNRLKSLSHVVARYIEEEVF